MGTAETGKSNGGEQVRKNGKVISNLSLEGTRYAAFICHQKLSVTPFQCTGFEEFIDLWLDEPTGNFYICTRSTVFATCQGEGEISCDLPLLRILISSLIIEEFVGSFSLT